MENGEIAGIIIVCTIITVLIAFVVAVTYDSGFISPLAAQDAQNICESKGYDTYETYDRQAFSTKALGVRCNYIQNRKEIITNSDTIVAVTN